MSKSIERTFSEEELFDVIARAEAMQKLDLAREDEQHFKDALSELPSLSDDGRYPQESLYAAAHEIGIPKEYIERALSRYPSIEEQIEDIKNHNASPNIRLIANRYKIDILNRLREVFPLQNFDAIWDKGPYHPSHKFIEVIELERRVFGLKKIVKKHKELSDFRFTSSSAGTVPIGKFNLDIIIMDPIFLNACGNTLKKLNDKFKDRLKKYHLEYDYENMEAHF